MHENATFSPNFHKTLGPLLQFSQPVTICVSLPHSTGSSAILVVFLVLTVSVFLALRIFDAARVIHMNMEVALLMAHFALLLTSDLVRNLVHHTNSTINKQLKLLWEPFHNICLASMYGSFCRLV